MNFDFNVNPYISNPAAEKLSPKRLGRAGQIAFALFAALVVCLCLATAARAEGDPLTVVNNLSAFIFSLIRAIGMILLGWGIVQVGLSFQSHDPSQRSQGFLTLAGGLVITFAKEILDMIVGTV
ncbi:glutamyl-tRNA amidotransferase [bacterium]|nr:glutamyl-tRNA amidotransferase [bacterium]